MNQGRLFNRAVEILLWAVAILVIGIPAYTLIAVAIRSSRLSTDIFDFSGGVTLHNFATAWTAGGFGPAFITTIGLTAASVALIVLFSALLAYPLARRTRGWSTAVFTYLVIGLIVPSVGTVPLYITMKNLHLIGSPWALLIIYVGTGMPINVALYTVFMRSTPRDFEEAAAIDGAGPVRMFCNIVFPMMRPVTATIVILSTINIYNEFFLPLLYLNGSDYATLPLALQNFSSEYFTNYGVIFAGLIISIAPILFFYLFMQRHITNSFVGGIKA